MRTEQFEQWLALRLAIAFFWPNPRASALAPSQWLALRLAIAFFEDGSTTDFGVVFSQWLALRLAIALPVKRNSSARAQSTRSGWLSAWPLR